MGVEACARCGTLLHSECVAADPVCPTIGCGPWRRGELPKPRLGPAQQLWRLAIETRNLAVLLAVIALIVVVVLLLFAHAVDRALPALPFF